MDKYCLLGFRVADQSVANSVEDKLNRLARDEGGVYRVERCMDTETYKVVSALVFNLSTLTFNEVSIRECIELADCDVFECDIDSDGSTYINLAGKSKSYKETGFDGVTSDVKPMIYGNSMIIPSGLGLNRYIYAPKQIYLRLLVVVFKDKGYMAYSIQFNLDTKDFRVYIHNNVVYPVADRFKKERLNGYHLRISMRYSDYNFEYLKLSDGYYKLFDFAIIDDFCCENVILDREINHLIIMGYTVLSSGMIIENIVIPPSLRSLKILGYEKLSDSVKLPLNLMISKNIDVSNFKVFIGDELVNIENLGSLYATLSKYVESVELYG